MWSGLGRAAKLCLQMPRSPAGAEDRGGQLGSSAQSPGPGWCRRTRASFCEPPGPLLRQVPRAGWSTRKPLSHGAVGGDIAIGVLSSSLGGGGGGPCWTAEKAGDFLEKHRL